MNVITILLWITILHWGGGKITHCANERECIKTLQKGIYDTGQTFAMCVEHFFEEVSSVNS